jgi:cytoplasmic iron level regulating protein YaaA (DUF328/UPF0246 family)
VALVLILLPPSEGKAAPRRGQRIDLVRLSTPQLAPAREQVLTALVELCAADPARAAVVLGLGPTQTDDVRRNAELRSAPTARADAIYTGVLYDALDLGSLDPAARRRATRWLAITSSLFGLVAPGDRIPSYRLPGATSLPGLGPVAAHWRGVLDPVVRASAGTGLVVDLRSTTYASFWRPGPDLSPRVAIVRVLHEADGRRSVVSHFNKATKGRLVRALLEHGEAPTTPAALADTITALGWKAELGDLTRHGHALDVIVEQL